jgi:hypothetical protein
MFSHEIIRPHNAAVVFRANVSAGGESVYAEELSHPAGDLVKRFSKGRWWQRFGPRASGDFRLCKREIGEPERWGKIEKAVTLVML